MKAEIQSFTQNAARSRRNLTLDLDISSFVLGKETAIVNVVRSMVTKTKMRRTETEAMDGIATMPLTKTIVFPYSRHSSYPELCSLVKTFQPKDIWPCTVMPIEWIRNGSSPWISSVGALADCIPTDITIQGLFGSFCSRDVFAHDLKLRELGVTLSEDQKQDTGDRHSQDTSASDCPVVFDDGDAAPIAEHDDREDETSQIWHSEDDINPQLHDSQSSALSAGALEIRRNAWQAMIDNATDGEWRPIGLLSTTDNHGFEESDLGTY